MEFQDYYENSNNRNIMDTTGPQIYCQVEGRARKSRGSRCLVLTTVCLGILCLLLIAAVIIQYFQCASKRGFLWGPDGLFMSNQNMSWSDSRHYCRDRGADLIIINTEDKQRHITSFIKERVWIGLSDSETEGIWKWVDNSALTQGFWDKDEPNNYLAGDEDCIELVPAKHTLKNWNDLRCSKKIKAICEK